MCEWVSSHKEFIEDNIIETDYANCVVNKNTRRSEKKMPKNEIKNDKF